MKIICWNCQMAFRHKADPILALKPDLLIVIECESKEKLAGALEGHGVVQVFWEGENEHKGIAVICFGALELRQVPTNLSTYRYILRFQFVNKQETDLWVIWAMPHKGNPKKSYVSQIWRALQRYKKTMGNQAILIGDFNSNAIWDKKGRVGNHTDVVKFLGKRDIVSMYHHFRLEQHGEEKEPTWYLHKKQEKPYHLDYCFVSRALIDPQSNIEVGQFKEWIGHSDHMPIVVELPALEGCTQPNHST